MNRVTYLLVPAGLVTASVFTAGVLSGDVARTAAVLSAAWLVAGLVGLLVGLRRRATGPVAAELVRTALVSPVDPAVRPIGSAR